MNFTNIPAFQNNCIWVLSENNDRCIIVDPSGAVPILTAVEESQWQPEAISLTHHHRDHVGGVEQLREKFPSIVVYEPVETWDKGVTQVVGDGDRLSVLGHDFSIFSMPGHTLGHTCYYSEPYLLCSNTTLSDGCGRPFEGTAEQVYQPSVKINALPEEILICCAHEYTLANMKFVLGILSDDRDINDHYHEVNGLRTKEQKTLPITLKNERRVGLFLRVNDIDSIGKINQGANLRHSVTRSAQLRSKKDDF